MKHLGKFVALTAIALAFAGTPAAHADPGINSHLVDGRITLGNPTEVDCSWTNGTYTGGPPTAALTINRSSINPPGGNLSCTGADNVTLNNDPAIQFGTGTATVDKVNTTGTKLGISCTYESTNVGLTTSDGSTYTGTFTAVRVSGSIFVCPSTSPGTASITFHH